MADCVHCVHSRTNLFTGEITCASEEAHRELGDHRVREQCQRRGEHSCPFFEDDELPW